jgi:hypothetical protein
MINESETSSRSDITDEIDKLVAQSAHIDEADIYERYEFISKLLDLTQRQSLNNLDKFAKATKTYEELVDKYFDLAQKYNCTPALLFTSFSVDPVSTLEILLRDIERSEKIEDQSGDAWKWTYKLQFRNRLKIARRLIFRPHVKEEDHDA